MSALLSRVITAHMDVVVADMINHLFMERVDCPVARCESELRLNCRNDARLKLHVDRVLLDLCDDTDRSSLISTTRSPSAASDSEFIATIYGRMRV